MNKYMQIGIFILIMFLLQYYLTYLQMNSFKKYFKKFITQGKVCIGIKKGGVKKGAIVMFLVDDLGTIKSYAYLYGFTVFARFKEKNTFNRINIKDIDDQVLSNLKYENNLKLAIINAVDNYNKVQNGEEIPTPKSLFENIRYKILEKNGG